MKTRFFKTIAEVIIALICAFGIVLGLQKNTAGAKEPVCLLSFQLDYSNQKENHCQIFYIDGKDNFLKEMPRIVFIGNRKFNIKIPCTSLKMLRIDFGSNPGSIRLRNFRCCGKEKLFLQQAKCNPVNMESCKIAEDSVDGKASNIDPFLEIYPKTPVRSDIHFEIHVLNILLAIFVFITIALLLRALFAFGGPMNSKNSADLLLIVTFILLIVLPLFLWDTQKEVSISEKRKLVKFTSPWLKDGTFDEFFQQNFTGWLNDHIVCRDQLLGLNAFLMRNLRYSSQLSMNTAGGKDGWFFDNIGLSTMRNFHNISKFPEEQMHETMQHLKFLHNYCEKKGKKFYILFLPDKYRIYGEFFPAAPQIRPDSESSLALFVKYLRKNAPELKVIYPIEELLKHKNEYPLYFKTDTHWTEMGAFFGGQEFLRTVRRDFPDLPLTEFRETSSRICACGDLYDYSNQQIPADWNTSYPEPVLPKNYRESKVGPITCIDNYKRKYSVFWVHDSFLIAMTPLMGNTFREIRGIRALYTFDARHFCLLDQADIVVMECLERYLPTFRSGICNSYELLKKREL